MSSSIDAQQSSNRVVFPGHNVSPERLALSSAAGLGDVDGVQRLLQELPLSIELPQPRAKYLTNARLAAAKNDVQDASKNGDMIRLQTILAQWKSETSIRDPVPEDFDLALLDAARGGHSLVVTRLFDEGAVLSHSAPLVALKEGGSKAIPVYQAFIDHGWDVNSFQNLPVLHAAVENEELTRFLLDQGADPNLTSSRGMKPLECATSLSTVSVVSLLLERGARLEECNALHHAVCTRKSDKECFEMMNFLLGKGVDINGRSWKIRQEVPCRTTAGTALMSAVKKQAATRVDLDMVERVNWLLSHGANPNIADDGGKKPIDYAVDQRLADILDGGGES